MKGKKIITVALITLVAICLITTGISAANLIGADSVQYKDTTVKAALDDLMDKASTCQDMRLASKVKLGDYVSMTPTSTTYKVPAALTGSSSDQTINPSELNLWRVIDIHEDGMIDMVSEYVSSTNVYFTGTKGYRNFVKALNTIAKQYENDRYTVGSRYMGYNGQTEYISSLSPGTKTTVDNSNEEVGGGDILYEKDYNLVKNILGTVVANKVGTTTATAYWLASRYYYYDSSDGGYEYRGRGTDASDGHVVESMLYCYNTGWCSDGAFKYIRPIVTLKSGLLALGSGTSDDPWILG